MWNDLFDLRPTNKEVAFGVLAVFVLLVGAGFCGYLLGWERAEDVYCNGSGVAGVGEQIGNAESNISNATAGIETAQGHAGNVQAGIDNATESAEYIHGTAKTSTELIGQCKSIIEAIRRRGKENTSAN